MSSDDEVVGAISKRTLTYGTQSITINCCESFNGQVVDSEGADETAWMVWPGSHLLCQYLNHISENLAEMDVLELGCGVGLCGILAARYSRSVTTTDGNLEVISVVEQNVDDEISRRSGTRLRAEHLLWGAPRAIMEEKGLWRSQQTVIASDVVYPTSTSESVSAMFQTVHDALVEGPEASFICTYVPRKKSVGRMLLELSFEKGFICQNIPWSSFLDEGERPLMDALLLKFTRRPQSGPGKMITLCLDDYPTFMWEEADVSSDSEWEAPYACTSEDED